VSNGCAPCTIRRMGLTFTTKKRRRIFRGRNVAILVVVAAIVAGAVAFVRDRDSGPPPLPTAETDAYLKAWSAGDTFAMTALIDQPPSDLNTTAMSLVKAVPGSTASYQRVSLVRDGKGNNSDATATYHARVNVAGFGPLEWNDTLTFTRAKVNGKEVWRIRADPANIYPGLHAGEKLTVHRKWPNRGMITAADGSVLAGNSSVVTIGIEPDRVTASLPQIKQLMKTLVGTDPASIDAALRAPGVQPNYFVPIATVPDDARYHNVLRPQLYPVPGVFFQRGHSVQSNPGVLGAAMIGNVGPITAERLKQLGPPYMTGDQVGLSGLQAAFEKRLAGTPTAAVVVAANKNDVRTIKTFPGHPAANVQLTLDPHTQQAAEAALAGVQGNAALVAVDTATGGLRAVVSKPNGGFDRALAGTYPPGSTFKVITSAALLAAGRSGTTPAPCPPTITVDGVTFHNFEGEASGSLDLAQAFQISCNNAFIGLGDQLPSTALTQAADAFGFNSKWSLPIESFAGSYPPPKDRAELAASAIGQGRVLASPAQMASVAAAVASGTWHAPTLTEQPAAAGPKVPPLSPAVAATLRSFMASVVTGNGTAAGAGLPPGTFGKTGTAEHGNGNPPKTHAWFIGYRGNIAFALIVEDGGVGGRVAAPLAAKFLNTLGG